MTDSALAVSDFEVCSLTRSHSSHPVWFVRWFLYGSTSTLVLVAACWFSVCLVGNRVQGQQPNDALQDIERKFSTAEGNQRLNSVTFRASKQVTLPTNIIRLGDVVEPVDADFKGWAKLSRQGIGLVPLDGTEMTIERARLESYIHGRQSGSFLVDWIGPQEIRVSYQRPLHAGVPLGSRSNVPRSQMIDGEHSAVLTASALSLEQTLALDYPSTSMQPATRPLFDNNPAHLEKLTRWITVAFAKTSPGGFEKFRIELVEIEKFRPTKRSLDVAILGSGFLQVVEPESRSTMFVRAGSLDVNAKSDLVLVSGQKAYRLNPTINIPPDVERLVITPEGVVQVRLPGVEKFVSAGRIVVSTTGKPDRAVGHFGAVSVAGGSSENTAKSQASGESPWQILQGFLEAPRSDALTDLYSIISVDVVTPLRGVHEGLCRFRVQGRGQDGPVDVVVGMVLTGKPLVAATRKSFPRGHRLSLKDLQLMPIDEDEVAVNQFTSLEKLVGMEVSKSLRVNRPVLSTDVRQPTLVRRGDLLDLRVVAAGIVVTTPAKALADGPLNELIEIETMRPRMRKVARVVAPGVVEILSRPPQVASLLKERR